MKKLFVTTAVLTCLVRAHAFSLLGAYTAYQQQNIGYQWGSEVNNIGGPMNIGEEYRWTQKNIYYSFDESFLNYFGQRGVDEVEKAVKILNDLPSMSSIDINTFPRYAQRLNYQAQSLGVVDMKSIVLQSLVEQMGITDPTRYVYTIRTRWTPNNGTNYMVIKRNFDPDTLQPSAYINGQLWSYNGIVDNQDAPISYPVNRPVDPLVFAEPVVTGFGWTFSRFTFGSYYTGLTRDDVAGLRYIYRPDNYNVESLPAEFSSSHFPGSGSQNTGGGTTQIPLLLSGDSPWASILVGTAPPTTISGNPGEIWGALLFLNTNGAGSNLVGVTATTNTASGTNGTAALRGGLDKLSFKRIDFDGLLGQVVLPVQDTFSDTIIQNGGKRSGTARRVVTQPDIIFAAADLTGLAPGAGGGVNGAYFMALRTANFVSNDGLNGNSRLDGPGQIGGPLSITLHSVGPFFFNAQPSFLSQGVLGAAFYWGAFDGTTNAPYIFPDGVSIRELEQKVTSGGR